MIEGISHCSWRSTGIAAVIAALISGPIALALPASASASFLIYRCGSNLCRVGPDGSGQEQLTTDGTEEDPYSSPSLSRDGTHLAFALGGHVYTADASASSRSAEITDGAVEVRMEPNGEHVMALQLVFLANVGASVEQLSIANLDGSGYDTIWGTTVAGGWGGTEEIGTSQDQYGNYIETSLCTLTSASPATCARTVASDPSRELFEPALSPDGSTLAVMAAEETEAAPSTIETFDYSTGQPIGDLTHGTEDQHPAWSPSGAWLAFQRGSSIYKIPAAGGAPQLIVSEGTEPTWGGTPEAGGEGSGPGERSSPATGSGRAAAGAGPSPAPEAIDKPAHRHGGASKLKRCERRARKAARRALARAGRRHGKVGARARRAAHRRRHRAIAKCKARFAHGGSHGRRHRAGSHHHRAGSRHRRRR